MLGDPQPQIDAMGRWSVRPGGAFIAACVRRGPNLTADIDLAFDDETPVEAMMHLACAMLDLAAAAYDEPQAAVIRHVLSQLQSRPATIVPGEVAGHA